MAYYKPVKTEIEKECKLHFRVASKLRNKILAVSSYSMSLD
jgi:hypothetical protein